MGVRMKPRRRQRRMARANLRTLAEWRVLRQSAIRADGGSGFARQLPGGCETSTREPAGVRRDRRQDEICADGSTAFERHCP